MGILNRITNAMPILRSQPSSAFAANVRSLRTISPCSHYPVALRRERSFPVVLQASSRPSVQHLVDFCLQSMQPGLQLSATQEAELSEIMRAPSTLV